MPRPTERWFNSTQRESQRSAHDWMRKLQGLRILDGMIYDTTDEADHFIIDVYANGYHAEVTHQDVDAWCVGINQKYDIGFPCRCVLNTEGDAFIVFTGSVQALEVVAPKDEYWHKTLQAWPASYDPATQTYKGLIEDDRDSIYSPFWVKTGLSDEEEDFTAGTEGATLFWLPFEGPVLEGEDLTAGVIGLGGGSGKGGVDIRQDGAGVQLQAAFINGITGTGVVQISFAVNEDGVDLKANMTPGGASYQYLMWNGSAWIPSYIRAH